MKIRTAIFAALCGTLPGTSPAIGMDIPAGARETTKTMEPAGSAEIPVGPFLANGVPTVTAEGTVTTRAWKIPSASHSTLQIMGPLREQLIADGYEIILDCETDKCGGFDFRFDISLVPEPNMHVDLGDFRFLSARRLGDGDTIDYMALTVSRGGESGFLQLTEVTDPKNVAPIVVSSTMSTDFAGGGSLLPTTALATQLVSLGRAPLDDLKFETGSSQLGDGSFGSLAELSAYLKTNPDKTIALVGHTDAEGSLAGNIALSKKRARSVMSRLISVYGIPSSQLEAEGVGYLVPRSSNLTDEGRTQNRRVEVILTSTN